MQSGNKRVYKKTQRGQVVSEIDVYRIWPTKKRVTSDFAISKKTCKKRDRENGSGQSKILIGHLKNKNYIMTILKVTQENILRVNRRL